ncbi:MAG: FprA family A-type flavoprotein, partial [Spirochaetota bacterium]|nr:FprA family A-type flavoprotein [Spirochaetota bacterium]
MKAVKMSEGIYRIGANIKNGDMFEGMWPIPDGVSLNCYVVKGDKSALIDMVDDWNDAPGQISEQLNSISMSLADFDYLILNHMEPDHIGWLHEFVKINPKVQILTTLKGVDLVKAFCGITDNVVVVKSGDTLDLGAGKVLSFTEVPNVHWPETMVTYEPESGILFSCDAFGSYGEVYEAIFDDELSQEQLDFYDRESLRYYANIIATFSLFVLKAIDKLAGLDIKMIAPSHGIVWRENPGVIIEKYKQYANFMNGKGLPEITLIWGSMYGYTEKIVSSVVKGIRSESVPVHVHRVPEENASWALADAWKSAGLVFGMPTYEYKMFPPIAGVVDVFEDKRVWNKKVFRFGSFGWS